ncbi:hypothetical protein [Acinetobacter sp. AC1-2]|uniref:hypothetical protein n=1 Tax=Acinetobacter sp. AC1-2 TaxID=2735132 RepID=UPI0018E0DFAD|nr:hypothetical protein [Acinetobacter sp. AC1-2]MBI1449635.1 hypothetical protein [Acinetobacter sp. AC1-2]
MKNIYILIFIGALMACSDKSPDKTQQDANHKSDVVQTDKNQSGSAVSEKKENADKTLKTADQEGEISCSNPNITQWYGFNDNIVESKCEVVKSFQLSAYKCDISKNAFGENKDAILLENQDKRIFVYSTSKDCNEVLEIRNANGP